MFDLKTTNRLVYYLTAKKDFIQILEGKIPEVRSGHYNITSTVSEPFHELCHFVESNDWQICQENLALDFNTEQLDLRECRVMCIEHILADKILDVFDSYWFPNKTTD